MARWQPDALGRLQEAALELYAERGFEPTAVADIAERAGLTERTFFRYFADKREVLFSGSEGLLEVMANAVAGAAASLTPIDTVAVALDATAAFFTGRLEHARRRQAVIDANPSLQERELTKLASMAAAVAAALRGRGVSDPAAALAAEAGISVFRSAFARWIDESNERDLAELMRETLGALKYVVAER
ncbi:MAG: TetR family transcriptional regulator [Mycobacterium sp.]